MEKIKELAIINRIDIIKSFFMKNRYKIIIFLIFAIGFSVRLIGLTEYPAGLNQDEASAGYEAWAILKSGMDRHGKTLPVHFIAWGSGQNVLYSYLMIPFVFILGLNELSVRLPMAIIGCISLIVVYKFLSKYNKKIAIIGLAFFAICPWHIMKSRWGLESNLFPDMVLMAVCILIISLRGNKIKLFYLGIVILSMSVYSYGTSYAFLPIFIALLLVYLLVTKKINFKNAIISGGLAGIITLPMILFVLINTFDLQEIKIGIITIPRVYQNRFQTATDIKGINIILKNLVDNLKIIILQDDGTNYNCIKYFGITYVVSLPFTIIGIWDCIKNRNLEKNILNIWFLVSLILLFIFNDANINRLNIIMIPIIMYTILGIYNITNNNKELVKPIMIMYCILYVVFLINYRNTQDINNSSFQKNLKEPLQYVASIDNKKIYIERCSYIYTLFYTQTSVEEFMDTVEYYKKNVAFEKIKSFGKYNFYIPKDMNEENAIYMVSKNYKYNSEKFHITDFGRFVILEPKD